MIKIALIRHSKTEGNLKGRYIGKTDEHLCEEGIKLAKSKKFPQVSHIYLSPLKRCIETADIIYKELNPIIIDELRECDFGDFENKNYKDLSGNMDYQKWIDSNGSIPFPNGENPEEFKKRSIIGFDKVVEDIIENKINDAAIIAHGGTIMSILDKYSCPNKDFYCWQVGNCCGYIIEINDKLWIKGDKKVKVLLDI